MKEWIDSDGTTGGYGKTDRLGQRQDIRQERKQQGVIEGKNSQEQERKKE